MEFKHIELSDVGSGITKDGYCFDEIEVHGYNDLNDPKEQLTDIVVITGVLYNSDEKEPTIELTIKYLIPELQENERVKALVEEGKEEILDSLVSLQNMPID